MATNLEATLKRHNGTDQDNVYLTTTWPQVENKPSTFTPTAHTHTISDTTGLQTALDEKALKTDSLYYVVGNTTGTAGTWTGTVTGLAAYYDGLSIAYKIGIAGAGTVTLNLNSLGAKTVRRNDTLLTTHLPVNTIVTLIYTTISGNGYFVWADFDSDSNYSLRTTGYYLNGDDSTYTNKHVMEGSNGKFYPLTLENTTGTTKTVSTRNFKIGGKFLYSTTPVSPNTLIRYYWYDREQSYSQYTLNQTTGYTQGYPIYIVGIPQADGSFKLDNSSYTSFFTQTLPTTEDGKIYIHMGFVHDDTYITFDISHPIYEYKDGSIRLFTEPHTHTTSEITDMDEALRHVYVYGKAQSAILKGQGVQFAGVQGDHILIKPAVPSEINANPDYFVGIAKADIAINGFGDISTNGEVVGLDTATNYNEGDVLWFASAGSTAGALTSTMPNNGYAKIQVGSVTKENATDGIILTRITLISRKVTELMATGTPSSTTFLRGDGTWATPADSTTLSSLGVTATAAELNTLDGITATVTELNYTDGVTSNIQTQLNAKADIIKANKNTQTAATTTTPQAIITLLGLAANSYYEITIYGMWSKVANGSANAPVITIAVDGTTGTPTWNGAFEWFQNPTAAVYATENNSANITTTTSTLGFQPTSSTSAYASTYFGIRGVIYTGTTAKNMTLFVANTATTNPVYVDRAYATAVKVA